MNKFPELDELLNYGDDYKIPDLIDSDYFIVDNKNKVHNNQGKDSNNTSKGSNVSQDSSDLSNEDSSNDVEESSKEDDTSKESNNSQDSSDVLNEDSSNDVEESSKEDDTSKESNENHDSSDVSNEDSSNDVEDSSKEDDISKESNENQDSSDLSDEDSSNDVEESSKEDDTSKESNESQDSSDLLNEDSSNDVEEFSKEESDTSKESNENQNSSDVSNEDSSNDVEDSSIENDDSFNDENDFDTLLDNYDQNCVREQNKENDFENCKASDKINNITKIKIYKVLKKLVSLSYENYQKGTYRYDKKAIIEHYLTKQRFKIPDDLESPVFKPDVYVFDLSPSNNNSLEMYVNAISSVAIKDSIIYLTYNNIILRKLTVKKQSSRGIDVKEVATSEKERYENFKCTVYNEYQSLYEELKTIKDRKIYIFSDLDISDDMVKLSKKNRNVVWFSTENNILFYGAFREAPIGYKGFYVDTKNITDIEKYIKENNKSKYRRRNN